MSSTETPQRHKPEWFHGDPELAREWNGFLSQYAGRIDAEARMHNASLLAELAFGEGYATYVALTQTDAEAAVLMRRQIEDAALALSEYGAPEGIRRDLHRAIVAAIVDRWTALKADRGLHPAPKAARATKAHREKADAAYRECLHSIEGGLLSGVLANLHNYVIAAMTINLSNTPGVTRDAPALEHALQEPAWQMFSAALRTYDPLKFDSFTSYLCNGLITYLPLLARGRSADRPPRDSELGDGVMRNVVNRRERDPRDSDGARMDVDHLLGKLTPRQREVLMLRYGIEDGHTRTLAEVGSKLGCTRERVRQIESEALHRLRAGRDDGRGR